MVRMFAHWILMVIAAMIGIQSIAFFVQACEIYVQARPQAGADRSAGSGGAQHPMNCQGGCHMRQLLMTRASF
jgi:hypothetical protein